MRRSAFRRHIGGHRDGDRTHPRDSSPLEDEPEP
jgi:hypothetical protein